MIGDLIQGREKSQIILIEGLHNAYNNINICKNIVLYLPVSPQGLVTIYLSLDYSKKNNTCFRVVEGYVSTLNKTLFIIYLLSRPVWRSVHINHRHYWSVSSSRQLSRLACALVNFRAIFSPSLKDGLIYKIKY